MNNFFYALIKKINLLTFIFLISFISPVNAKNKESAENLVTLVGENIIRIVDSDSSFDQKQIDFNSLINDYADVLTISRAALGTTWRKIDINLRNKFVISFQNYLIKKYGKQFNDFKGSKMIIERSIDAGKRGILVNSRFLMPGSTPISVSWQLWSASGELKIIDIIIEGISMLTMEREEMKNRLQLNGGDVTELIINLEIL